jgi:hypothetical protein
MTEHLISLLALVPATMVLLLLLRLLRPSVGVSFVDVGPGAQTA